MFEWILLVFRLPKYDIECYSDSFFGIRRLMKEFKTDPDVIIVGRYFGWLYENKEVPINIKV